jgi:hypothetical protein
VAHAGPRPAEEALLLVLVPADRTRTITRAGIIKVVLLALAPATLAVLAERRTVVEGILAPEAQAEGHQVVLAVEANSQRKTPAEPG